MTSRHPKLGRPPLRVALCQLRYPEHFAFADADAGRIHEALRATYPRGERGLQQMIQITPEKVEQVQTPQTIYRLTSEDQTWIVTLTSSFVTLETTKYNRFDDFLSRWEELAEVVIEQLRIERQERLGLRYVNELTVPGEASLKEGLMRIVRPEVLGLVAANSLIEDPFAAATEIRFKHSGGMATLRHGLQVADETATYLLDVDAYEETAGPIDLVQQSETLRSFNDTAYSLFKACVTDEQFEAFKPSKEDEENA